MEPIWVQAHDLPLRMMNQTYEELLGQLIGEVEDIDVDKDGLEWGLFFRNKV